MHRKIYPGRILPVLIAFFAVSFTGANISAQTTPLWGDLQPGPYTPGFKTIEKYDFSRTFQSRYDYFGEEQPGQTARPIQVCVWYPAVAASDDIPRMVYGEYAFPFPADNDFINLLSELQDREIGILNYFLNRDNGLVNDMMSLSLSAVRDGEPESGPFPLIIYHGGFQASYCENVLMCEYLASHGFVVATSHALGTTALNAQLAPADLESAIRDKEFVLATMTDDPMVDRNKIGLLGFADGGLSALIMQMRNFDIKAVASLEGAFISADHFDMIRDNAFFKPERMTVPMMLAYAETDESVPDMHDLTIYESLIYAPRQTLVFEGLQPTSFTSYSLMAAQSPSSSADDAARARNGYYATCRYVLNFFNGHLNGNEAAVEFLNRNPEDNDLDPQLVSMTSTTAAELPPTAEQFLGIIRGGHTDVAAELCEKFNLANPENPILDEATFQAMGYRFLQRRRTDLAIMLFTMGASAFPASANSWDCLGESYAANGDIQLAIDYYKKALEVLPDDKTSTPQILEEIKTNAPETIKSLEARL